tara:strand:+ start:28142 stop:28528 length:387 start_codon:yes stop_codon:yes gene_type:complete
MSRDRYVLTRTRTQFEADARSVMKTNLLTVEIIGSMFEGDSSKGGQPSQGMPDPYDQVRNAEFPDPEHLQKAGPEMSDQQAAEWARRESRSHKPYGWYKMSSNRRYHVVNLDTRNPKAFMTGVKKFGK